MEDRFRGDQNIPVVWSDIRPSKKKIDIDLILKFWLFSLSQFNQPKGHHNGTKGNVLRWATKDMPCPQNAAGIQLTSVD